MAPAASAGASTAVPRPGAVWATSCPGCQAPVAASPDTRLASSASGHREQHQLAALDDLGHRQDRHPGQHRVGAVASAVGHGRDADDRVAGAPESGAEHRAHAAGTDDADAEAAVAARTGSCRSLMPERQR